MDLDPRTCYRALRTRDARFDGRFFTAVRTTGVFCRPICPARTPRQAHCTFLPSAAAAREQGYRPCLRCRPEASPGTPTWLGTSSVVSRALRLIEEGELDDGSVECLAQRVGVGERHLRRLFLRHLGATPIAVAQTRRILFAKKLIDETCLPMADVAHAAGFSSVRRFNDALRRTYARSPRELRRAVPGGSDRSSLRLLLSYRPPFDWRTISGFLARRAIPGVESVADGAYRRTVCLGNEYGWIEVRPASDRHQLVAELHLSGSDGLIRVAERIRRIFDLGAEPQRISTLLARDSRLRSAIRRHPGIRVPGAWDGFELAVRAILGQLVSVQAATTTAGRLAAGFGEPLRGNGARPEELSTIFPGPEILARADLTGLGLTRAKAGAIRALARAVIRGAIVLDPASDPERTIERLQELPGIGPWTAQVIAMRALDHPDAFPAADLGLRQALADASGRKPAAREVERIAEAWRPFRAYGAVCLWLENA